MISYGKLIHTATLKRCKGLKPNSGVYEFVANVRIANIFFSILSEIQLP